LNNLDKVRVSGCEPLINKAHILEVVKLAVTDGFKYVLDTNGLLLDEDFLNALEPYKANIYIYMGLKGANPCLFQKITKADKQYWKLQLEALRLVAKHNFTLGVNLIANFNPSNTLPKLFSTLYKICPVLPMTLDMKKCTFFTHNNRRVVQYGLKRYTSMEVKARWNAILEAHYGADNTLLDLLHTGETQKAFDKPELKLIAQHVEWADGLKFLHSLPFKVTVATAPIT
jgi:hypothetical protein